MNTINQAAKASLIAICFISGLTVSAVDGKASPWSNPEISVQGIAKSQRDSQNVPNIVLNRGEDAAEAAHLLGKSMESEIGNSEMVALLEAKGGKSTVVVTHAGAIVSIVELTQGISELRCGEKLEGSRHTAIGTAAATSSVAVLSGCLVLEKAAGAVGAGTDGCIDLYTGIHKNDPEKTAVGTVKTTVFVLIVSSAVQPELAPVLVPVAFLTYSGAVVVDVVYENREIISDKLYAVSVQAQSNTEGACNVCYKGVSAACDSAARSCTCLKRGYDHHLESTASAIYESGKELKDWLNR